MGVARELGLPPRVASPPEGPRQLLSECAAPTRTHYLILGMCWAGWLFDFYDLMLFSFLLVPIQHELGLGPNELSLLLGTSLAATALGGIAFGWLADRRGRRTVLSWTILVYCIGTFLCGLAGSLGSLLVFRIITGIGVGGEWGTGQTLVAESCPARLRARFAALMQTGAPLGMALAAVVGGLLEPRLAAAFGPAWGWRSCFFVSVSPAVLVVIIRRCIPESDVWLSRGVKRPPLGHGAFAELFADRQLRRLFGLGQVLTLAGMSAYWFTFTWLPTYLYEQLGLSMSRSAEWMLVTQLGALLGYVSFGVLADSNGRRIIYTCYSLLWAAGLLAVTWFWGALAAWPGLILACMFVVGLGTGKFSGYGPILAELFPTQVRSTAMGAAFNLARGVQFFTPLLVTEVAGRYGLGGGISLAALFALFGGLWIWVLPETRGTRIVEPRGEVEAGVII